MEKLERDHWIEDYGDYTEKAAAKHVSRRLWLIEDCIITIFNARNEYYAAMGLLTPGPIVKSPSRMELRAKCDQFIKPENSEMDILCFPDLINYIEHATQFDVVQIIQIILLDAEYTLEWTGWERCEDLIDWCERELDAIAGPPDAPHLRLIKPDGDGE